MYRLGKWVFLRLVLTIIFALAFVIPVSAGAVITVNIDPDSGPVGTLVHVWGVAIPDSNVHILWDGSDIGVQTSAEQWAAAYDTDFTIPDSEPGEHLITAYDGTNTSSPVTYTVNIENNPPTAPVIDVTPDRPATTSDLVCTIITPSTDANSDIIIYTYEWYKDDELQNSLTTTTTELSAIIGSSNTSAGQVWRCVVTSYDGIVYGLSDDDEVTINMPPAAPVVDVIPNAPLITDTLTCMIITPSTDADSDAITYSYKWYKNDVEQIGLTTTTVPAANIAVDEVWKCVVTPNDGIEDGASGYDLVVVGNSPPTAPVIDVTPNFPVTTDNLVCTIITPGTDADGNAITYTYQWYKNNVAQVGLTNGTVTATNTAKGEVWKCKVTPNDGKVNGASAFDEVTIQNSQPSAPVVDVVPNNPVTTDDLVCTIVTPSTDADGDSITYTYYWYKDYAIQPGLTTNTVPAAETAADETWMCMVYPYDGTISGSFAFDGVVIQNRAPSAPVVDVTPNFPVTTDDLICTIIIPSTDDDGDTVTYSYQWYENYLLRVDLTTSTVPASETAVGETWICMVYPYDGTVSGSFALDGVVIKNRTPTAPVVDVTPNYPVTTNNLVCNITTNSTDADGDIVTYTYQWYKNGVLQPGLTTDTVPAANTTKGEIWMCMVTPNDGIDNGPSAFDMVTIQNKAPMAPVVDITPDSPGTDDDLVCDIVIDSTDTDEDIVTYTYQWYKNGDLQVGLTTETVDAAYTTTGEVWMCRVTPNDGTVNGSFGYDIVTIL